MMKIEKLEKSHKNKIIVGGLISLGIIVATTILPSHAKYKITESIKIGEGVVNYKVPDFKVMAMYKQNEAGAYEEVTTMPSSDYAINEEKTYCTTDNVNQVKGKIKTFNGIHGFTNLNKADKCYLYFDKLEITDSVSLIANSKVNIGSPNFNNVATTDEGIYAVYDNIYKEQSYYFRGAVTNNYIKFANFCWRIVRINGDGSIRIIYDGATCHENGIETEESIVAINQTYAKDAVYDRSEYVGYTYTVGSQRGTSEESNLKAQTESWYTINIANKGYDAKVATGKFCNDRSTASGNSWSSQPSSPFYYAAYGRLVSTTATPTLNCRSSSDVYSLKVGAITADEVSFAGGAFERTNTGYYLYNGQKYWTISPAYWRYFNSSTRYANVFSVFGDGCLSFQDINIARGIRPVINLLSDTQFKAGTDGTLNNPYEVI